MFDYYSQEYHGPFEMFDVGPLALKCGKTLSVCQLAVSTHGELNVAKDNAILVPTWYSGTSKIIEHAYIGPGRALDPERYFIIVVNQIGGGLSTSAHNYEGDPGDFPQIDVSDDVTAQHRLISDHYGVQKLAMVFGGSMGGQQALHWGVLFPEAVNRIVAIAATALPSDYVKIALKDMYDGLAESPAKQALKRHAQTWALMGWSQAFYRHSYYVNFGMETAQTFAEQFMVEYFATMDPAALCCMLRKAGSSNPIGSGGENGLQALATIEAPTLFLPIDHDQIFSVDDCKIEQQSVPVSKLEVLSSEHGHLALFGGDSDFLKQIDEHVADFLDSNIVAGTC